MEDNIHKIVCRLNEKTAVIDVLKSYKVLRIREKEIINHLYKRESQIFSDNVLVALSALGV